MKINRSVGKGCFADASDTLVVQTALANVRNKQGQFYYKGRLDGANSAALQASIGAFECDNGFRPTYKIEATGPRWSRLKEKTPFSVKNRMSAGMVTSASASSQSSMKAQQCAKRTCDAIKKAPLPNNERDSLLTAVTELGKQAVPLNLKSVTITPDGRFQATLTIDPSALPTGNEKQRLEQSLKLKISEAMGKSKAWNKGNASNLVYKSHLKLTSIQNAPQPTPSQIKSLGLNSLMGTQTFTQLMKGFIFATNKRGNLLRELTPITQAILNTISSPQLKSTVQQKAQEALSGQNKFRGLRLHPISVLKITEKGIDFIKQREGSVIKNGLHVLYNDSGNNATIGYGTLVHLGPVSDDGSHPAEKPYLQGISEDNAVKLLETKIKVAESDVHAIVGELYEGSPVLLTTAMFDAYVSLLFNIGRKRADAKWQVFQQARKGNYEAAASEFLNISLVNDVRSTGVENRRRLESELFLNGTY